MSKSIAPLISVIIPAYNEEGYIGKCLDSLLNQDLNKKFFEIIVVDNGSNDNTGIIAKHYPVKLIKEPKRSVVIARRTASLASKGKIIVSADADTIYPPCWLSRIKKDFSKDPEIIALVGWIYYTHTSKLFNYGVAINQQINLLLQKLTGKFPVVFACNFAFKKIALIEIGGYPTYLPELGDQQYLLFEFQKLGKVVINKRIFCFTSGRRHSSKFKNIIVYNGWYRLIGYTVNRLLGKQVIGSAPAIRTQSNLSHRSHFWQRND